jgi:hypothetical protein
MNLDLKDHIKGQAHFQYYRAGELWYKTEAGLLFPVPIADVYDGTFNAEEKGIHMMRYIRKHIEALKTELAA